jgi:hypothetical protein
VYTVIRKVRPLLTVYVMLSIHICICTQTYQHKRQEAGSSISVQLCTEYYILDQPDDGLSGRNMSVQLTLKEIIVAFEWIYCHSYYLQRNRMNRLKISISIRTFLERLCLVCDISSLRDVRCDAVLQHTPH